LTDCGIYRRTGIAIVTGCPHQRCAPTIGALALIKGAWIAVITPFWTPTHIRFRQAVIEHIYRLGIASLTFIGGGIVCTAQGTKQQHPYDHPS